MAIAKAGIAGRMYHESLVWAMVNTKSTMPIQTKSKVSAFARLNTALKAQSPVAKGNTIAHSLSLLIK